MTFKTKIPDAFISGANYWLDKTHEISWAHASVLLYEVPEYLNGDEHEQWHLCQDDETLCYFDLLVGAAQP